MSDTFNITFAGDGRRDEAGRYHETLVMPDGTVLGDAAEHALDLPQELFDEYRRRADQHAPSTNPKTNPRGRTVPQNGAPDMPQNPAGELRHFVPPEASAPVQPLALREDATYEAHLHNLEQLGLDAERAKTTAEMTLSAAVQAEHRAVKAIEAVELMAQGLAAQDFGAEHVANVTTLGELFAVQARHAKAAVTAANQCLDTSEQVDRLCGAATVSFRRDHQQLAEAYQAAPHPAKTREAYNPM